MTGSDLKWWLNDLWYDLKNWENTDLLSLGFRLLLVWIAAYFAFSFIARLRRYDLSRLSP